MSNNPYPRKAEESYQAYWEENQDWLLEQFLENNPDLPQVKDWDNKTQKWFDEYVQSAYLDSHYED